MTAAVTEVVIRKPSIELLELINSFAEGWVKSKELSEKIVEEGEKEGFSKVEIRTLIEEALLSRGLTDRRIRQILPADLKDNSKTTLKSKVRNSNEEIISASQQPNLVVNLQPNEPYDTLEEEVIALRQTNKEHQGVKPKLANGKTRFSFSGSTKEQILKILDKGTYWSGYLEIQT